MQKREILAITCMVLCVARMGAQTTVTTTGGTSGFVPVFTGSSTVGNSPLSVSGGNVGIGTTSPITQLDTPGVIHASGSLSTSVVTEGAYFGWNALTEGTGETDIINGSGGGGGGFAFMNIPNTGAARTTLMFLNGTGNLGIGTTAPTVPLTVVSGVVSANGQIYNHLKLQPSSGAGYSGNGVSILLSSATNHGIEPIGGIWSSLVGGGDGGVDYAGALVFGSTRVGNAAPVEGMRLDYTGNVGIGTSSPGAKLEVTGSIKLTSGTSGAALYFADGTTQSTAWTGVLCGGDYAESVKVADQHKNYDPGDVLVIAAEGTGDVDRSTEPYSTMVAGIFSTKPGLLGRRQPTPKSSDEIPMAMVGIVPAKASAENGAIRRGDLLVTSSTPGHVMKGTDRDRMLGAVVGKAMGTLDSGTGVIEVLVSLQ